MKIKHKILFFFIIVALFLFLIFWTYVITSYFKEDARIIRPSTAVSEKNFLGKILKTASGPVGIPENKVFGGIVPHHLLVKEKIDIFFEGIKKEEYDTVVLIGPDHFSAAKQKITTSISSWDTPYGKLEADEDAIRKIVKDTKLTIEEAPLKKEHSIFNLVPFIKKTFPEAKVIPIILNLNTYSGELDELANQLKNNLNIKKTLVLASVDFSHNQPELVADFHDQRSNSIISNFDMERVYSMEVDSPPSIYALLSYLSLIKSQKSELLSRANSGAMMKTPDEPTTSHNVFYFTKGNSKDEPLVNFLFFGDLMLDRDIEAKIKKSGFGPLLDKIAGEEKTFFKGVDYISANLEGVFADEGNYYLPEKEIDFSFNPAYLKELSKYNFNFFNLANNHAEDQSRRGFEESIKNLNKNNFLYSGCLGGWKKDCGIKVLNKAGKKIAMVGVNYFSSRLKMGDISEAIENMDGEFDYIIINIHWGAEYSKKSSDTQKEIAHNFIDRGADLIIGHHPHVVQELEIYKNKQIFYSLGNFIFDQYWSKDVQEGLAVGVSLSDKAEIYLFPFKTVFGRVELMKGKEKNDFLNNI